jgi:hypothetical protein
MSVSKSLSNFKYRVKRYTIVDIKFKEDWVEVSDIEVLLKDKDKGNTISVEALRYGGLYNYVLSNKQELRDKEHFEFSIDAVLVNNQIEFFGKKHRERFQSILNSLKNSDIQRKR